MLVVELLWETCERFLKELPQAFLPPFSMLLWRRVIQCAVFVVKNPAEVKEA
jgi:hypothetical protein